MQCTNSTEKVAKIIYYSSYILLVVNKFISTDLHIYSYDAVINNRSHFVLLTVNMQYVIYYHEVW